MRFELNKDSYAGVTRLFIRPAKPGHMLGSVTWGRQWLGGCTFARKLRLGFGFRFGFELCLRMGEYRGAGHRGGYTLYFAFRGRGNGAPAGFHVLVPFRAGLTQDANSVPLF